jgi:hypothetical protein
MSFSNRHSRAMLSAFVLVALAATHAALPSGDATACGGCSKVCRCERAAAAAGGCGLRPGCCGGAPRDAAPASFTSFKAIGPPPAEIFAPSIEEHPLPGPEIQVVPSTGRAPDPPPPRTSST